MLAILECLPGTEAAARPRFVPTRPPSRFAGIFLLIGHGRRSRRPSGRRGGSRRRRPLVSPPGTRKEKVESRPRRVGPRKVGA